MNIFIELEAQYYEIDNRYSSKEFEAKSKEWSKKENDLQRKRELNDQAYYLFMFSRLEARINDETLELIKKKQKSISSWKQRAPWDILPNKKIDDIPFKKRLALLSGKGSKNYNKIMNYYEERNSIAHGGDFKKNISMPNVISEFKSLYKSMKSY